MLQPDKTIKRLLLCALAFMLITAMVLFCAVLMEAGEAAGLTEAIGPQGPKMMIGQWGKTLRLGLLLAFLFSVALFMVMMQLYVDELTMRSQRMHIKAKEAEIKRPLNTAKGDVTVMRDYTAIAKLANIKHIPLLKYGAKGRNTMYYLVDGKHLYLYKERSNPIKLMTKEALPQKK